MKHTKNILKSLLITVMALSLFAVSCKKDENGGGGTPTNPTPNPTPTPSTTKIEGTTIADAIKNLGTDVEVATAKVNFQSVTEIKATIDLTATKGAAATVADTFKTDMKTKLEGITVNGATVTVGNAAGEGKKDNKNPITFEVTIKANDNYELDSTIAGYQASDESVKFTVSVTPSENWG